MKRFSVFFLLFLILALAGLIIAPSILDWNAHKATIMSQVKSLTGYDVTIEGDINLAIIPAPKITIEKMHIKQDGDDDDFLSLARLDVNVALAPLLKKQIVVNSIDLVDPILTLRANEQGRIDVLPKASEASTAQQGKLAGNDKNSASDLSQSISLQSFDIQNATVRYINLGDNKNYKISKLNAHVAADTLRGPWMIDGSLNFQEQDFKYTISTGLLSDNADALSVKTSISLQQNELVLNYAGVVPLKAPFELQGETSVSVVPKAIMSSFPDVAVLAQKAEIKGLLTASEKAISLKGASVTLGSDRLNGDVKVNLASKPLHLDAKFKASSSIDVRAYQPKGFASGDTVAAADKTSTHKQNVAWPISFLPDSISLPMDVNGTVDLSFAMLSDGKAQYKGASLKLSKEGKSASIKLDVPTAPGKSKFNFDGSLVFADSSTSSKSGTFTLSEPVLNARFLGDVGDLAAVTDASAATLWKQAKLDVKAVFDTNSVTFKDAFLSLGDSAVGVSGNFALPILQEDETLGRAKANLQLSVNALNLDEINSKLAAKKPVEVNDENASAEAAVVASAPKALISDDVLEGLKAGLPFDLNLDLGVSELKAAKHDIKGTRIQLAVDEKSLGVPVFSIHDLSGLQIRAEAGIKTLSDLTGITGKLNVQSANLRQSAGGLGVKAENWPDKFAAPGRVIVSFTGDTKAGEVVANLSNAQGQLSIEGQVQEPLKVVTPKALKVQLKYNNFGEFLNLIVPDLKAPRSARSPLDFYAEVKPQNGGVLIDGIKADLSGTALTGNLSILQNTARPTISGALKLGDVFWGNSSVKNSKSVRRVHARSSGSGKSQKSRWSGRAIDSAWMRAADIDLEISAKSLRVDPWELSAPSAQLALKDGVLDIAKLSTGIWEGNLDVTGQLKAGGDARAPLAVSGDIKLRDVNFENLLESLAGSALVQGSGLISADAKLTSSGVSQSALVYDLQGNGALTGKDLTLKGIDVTAFAGALSQDRKPGDTLSGIWGATSQRGSTVFEVLDGEFLVKNGVVDITKLDLDGPAAHLATTGDVDLPRWRLNTQHEITMKKDGEASDIPPFKMAFSGPLDNPAQTFGKGALQDYLTRKINRKLEKLLSDKLGLPGLLGAPANDNAAPTIQGGEEDDKATGPVKPEEALRGILEGLIR